MKARIQHARMSDGFNIAYAVHGQGNSLVALPGIPWTHLQTESRTQH
jgi:hypothetical protein